MDTLEHKTVTTSRGFTYSYYISQPTSSKPPLLLQHGFPDDARIWDGIVARLAEYRLVVPDLLGYSGTSKPTDPTAYGYDGMAQDLIEILDAEGIKKVVSVGHDFGSMVAQRLYNFHRDRVEALILLTVPYLLPPESPPDLEEINARAETLFGYPAVAYQEFFVTDEAPAILKAHVDRLYDGSHGAPAGWMREIFCTRGATRKWLLDEERKVELLNYAQDPALRQSFIERFQRDGFEGPVCYYKAGNSTVQYDALKGLTKEQLTVQVPVLYIGCTQDAVCLPVLIQAAKQGGFLPDLEEAIIDSHHWPTLEKPDEVAELILSFLERRFAS
ncbi:hypothetical protein SLS62_010068 [Diatrype stigma]|uniref:AB hydrolase-1 domain-containing protein n=1 Tax=Diatrype stigma TaxID=117547 RepID=A0AAN9UAX4_9PEZI